MIKKPTEILEEEHHVIQKVVGVMATILERLEKGGEVKGETIKDVATALQSQQDS